MIVKIVVPVHNRLEQTKILIDSLRNQVVDHQLHILVVNDGSTDGTKNWLSAQHDIEVLTGDGSLLWGGAVDLALRHLRLNSHKEDWVLLMNNDTVVDSDFVKKMLEVAYGFPSAVVSGAVYDVEDKPTLLSIGLCIDAWRFRTSDILETKTAWQNTGVVEAPALSGRGLLIPMAVIDAVRSTRPWLFPHYRADYDLTMRIRKRGWRLLVALNCPVYSKNEFGSQYKTNHWLGGLIDLKSTSFGPALCVFWWTASTWMQRLTMPLRVIVFWLLPWLRR